MSLKIGITEQGDAGINLTWQDKLNKVDGAILITKNITTAFSNALLRHHKLGTPIILHANCTGWGHTNFEPNIPTPENQLKATYKLLEKGFPIERLVLRMDPIIPTTVGLTRFDNVLKKAEEIGLPIKTMRKRISIYDEYPHIRERLAEIGYAPIYNGYFYAAPWVMESVAKHLDEIYDSWGDEKTGFDSCAEPVLAEKAKSITASGCVSPKDIEILGLDINELADGTNFQNRKGCLCCAAKRELLTQKRRCPNGCIYCYWKG